MAKEFLEVKCKTDDGVEYYENVEGIAVGPLFVHQSLLKRPRTKPLWTVTHCRTGYNVVFQIATKRAALDLAHDLAILPWGETVEAIRGDAELKRSVRACLLHHGVRLPDTLAKLEEARDGA